MVNKPSLFKGNAAPVKNINRNRGKLPTTSTSFAVFVSAAIIRLKAIIDKLVRTAIRMKTAAGPWNSKPNTAAVIRVRRIDIIPTINWTIVIPEINSKEEILDSLSRKIVLFSTSETNAIVAVNISIITDTIRIPGTIRSLSQISLRNLRIL
jgi:hypothetical protein